MSSFFSKILCCSPRSRSKDDRDRVGESSTASESTPLLHQSNSSAKHSKGQSSLDPSSASGRPRAPGRGTSDTQLTSPSTSGPQTEKARYTARDLASVTGDMTREYINVRDPQVLEKYVEGRLKPDEEQGSGAQEVMPLDQDSMDLVETLVKGISSGHWEADVNVDDAKDPAGDRSEDEADTTDGV